MTFWDFWDAHPFLCWCALWLLWGLVVLGELAFNMLARALRTIQICARGYPPEEVFDDEA
ncbi:MAG TPA: hypothetical protein VFL54_09090 [Gammaproteobacteria bacterium]|nr:hypothetical protein [Gammaproteobacteria bacterium]